MADSFIQGPNVSVQFGAATRLAPPDSGRQRNFWRLHTDLALSDSDKAESRRDSRSYQCRLSAHERTRLSPMPPKTKQFLFSYLFSFSG